MADAQSAARVMERCDALGGISEQPNLLVRPYGLEAMRRANDTVAGWMGAAGMAVQSDVFGNLVGRYEGTVVGVLGRHFSLLSLNACRIAYTIEDETPSLRRYGFAFGTLPGHLERGEERFTVGWHGDDDSVWYEVFAFARPAYPLAKVGTPYVRLVQRRFAVDSLRAIAAAVSAANAQSGP
jgi:uncharacterized protein (UPF0548 family)